ncbi:MAG: carbon storage regulator [Pirellulales bacterium]
MLVLSRKPGEQIRVGDDITITVVEVRGNRIKIGIEAPRSVGVARSELEPKARRTVGRAVTTLVAEQPLESVVCVH